MLFVTLVKLEVLEVLEALFVRAHAHHYVLSYIYDRAWKHSKTSMTQFQATTDYYAEWFETDCQEKGGFVYRGRRKMIL